MCSDPIFKICAKDNKICLFFILICICLFICSFIYVLSLKPACTCYSAMILCCLFYLLVISLGTKRSQSSVGKALLAFLGVNPPALKVGPCEYAMMSMLDVKILCYLFPVVMQCNVTPDFHH